MKDNHIDSTQINTGIIYLPVPNEQIQFIQPQQLLNNKSEIEQNFSLRYHYSFNEDFQHLNSIDAHRYKTFYENLYHQVLQSIFNIIDLNQDIQRIKHSIKYHIEILPILIHNHKLAKQEKKILYEILRNTWQQFDERIQNEINQQYQLKQIKNEHEYYFKLKIQQEQYLKYSQQINQIHNEIIDLKHEIQQLSDYKRQLIFEYEDKRNECTQDLIKLDHLKTIVIHHYLTELNALQLERDSLITEIELIKYNLFEQIQENDQIIRNYRQSLNSFRLTINELEQQLKQQTDIELNHLQISNEFSRQTIINDTEKLITILEIKINEKKLQYNQLEISVNQIHEKILQQKHILIKKENEIETMNQIEHQLNSNIRISREIYHQLKTDRRIIERELNVKLKEYITIDRFYHTIIQQHDSLFARKRIEQIRYQTSNDQLSSLIDENHRLKTYTEQLNQQCTNINSKNLTQLNQQIIHLKEIHRISYQEFLHNQIIQKNFEYIDEQSKKKLDRITLQIKNILEKFNVNHRLSQDNFQYILIIEKQLNQQQNFYLNENSRFKQIKIRTDNQQIKRNYLNKQIQFASNNIQQFHYRLKIFNEQLTLVRNDFVQSNISLKKLNEFHTVLKQQDENNLKRISRMSSRLIDLEKQIRSLKIIYQQENDEFIKLKQTRSILVRIIIRRNNLCQLLYQKLTKSDRNIYQNQKYIEMINKYIKILINQIRQIRNENEKILQRNNRIQLKTVKIHVNRMFDNSHKKQQVFIEQIYQRNYLIKHSTFIDRLPTEDIVYLEKKYVLLKKNLIKIIFRGMNCNLILLTIQQEFTNRLEFYISPLNRMNQNKLNDLRLNLDQLMRQFKAKSAEMNMLIDYQYYFQFIHIDMMEQLMQWKLFE